MKKQFIRTLILFVPLVLTPWGGALPHGDPVIVVNPAVVAVGGRISVVGTEMDAGQQFTITLEGVMTSIPLGEAVASDEGGEGGFETTLTIPNDTPPGWYTVRAASTEGKTAVADLTVTAPTAEATNQPATVLKPTGELHQLDRSKSLGQIIAVIITALASIGLGFWLIRQRVNLG
jgi:hypothetical protein